jgi:hypothetical protein
MPDDQLLRLLRLLLLLLRLLRRLLRRLLLWRRVGGLLLLAL